MTPSMLRILVAFMCLLYAGSAFAQKPVLPADRTEEVIAALPANQQPSARMILVRGSSVGRRIVRSGLSAAGSVAPVKGKPATAWKEKSLLAKVQAKMNKAVWKSFAGLLGAQSKQDRALLVKMLGIRIDLPRRG